MPTEDSKPSQLFDLARKLGVADRAPHAQQILPTKLATALDDAMQLPKKEVHRYNNAPLDANRVENKPTDNFDQKIYMFPESYNALRIELSENWKNLWELAGYPMAYDGIRFCQILDAALDTKTTFDTHTVDGICKKYLDLLRNRRGLSSLHTQSEKA